MLNCVCLLGSNSNVYAKPEKTQFVMGYNWHWNLFPDFYVLLTVHPGTTLGE